MSDTTLSDYRHSRSTRALLRKIVPIVLPPEVVERDRMDATIDHMELSMRALPTPVRLGLRAGLLAFEWMSVLWPGNGGWNASQLDPKRLERYYQSWWKSHFALFTEFAKGVRQLAALSYWELDDVKAEVGYTPDPWIELVKKRRMELHGDEVRRHEATHTQPEPLRGVTPPPWAGRARRAIEGGVSSQASVERERPAGIYTRDDLLTGGDLACDVVIVGSGAGGASMAAELAEAGLDVIVLEEGGYNRTEEFTSNATAMIRKMYRDGGASAALGTPPVFFQEGRTVGGSTVVNGAMAWRTPEPILKKWQEEDHLDRIGPAEMAYFYERVEKRIHVAYQDPETIGRDNELLRLGAERQGWKYIPNTRNQNHCAGSNNCAFGCPTGAKQSALVSWIPRAVHFGARVYANVRVTRILHHRNTATGVEARISNSNGSLGRTFRVHARLVVSAAGAMQTPALLMRSGFKSASGMLGGNLSLHPNGKVFAVFDEDVRGWEGVHQAYQVRHFQDQGFLMAAVNVPPNVVAMTMPTYGKALGEAMKDYAKIVTAGILVEDTTVGRVRTAPNGQPYAFYNLNDADAEQVKRGVALLSELLFAAGARKIILPFAGAKDLLSADDAKKLLSMNIPKSHMEIVTVHLMGTARMGSDPKRAVCDSYGHVYGFDRLVVSDGSLFPSPIGVNPAETIQALSVRNAAYILDNHQRFLS
ncbi:MAG: GMC family oxidoreductase [Deltaproteobacteria bacterium]|nr:GMC family oxidoreductase [Deltaproteobacteria bacterium]